MNNRAELLNFRTGDELAAAAASAWLKHLLASSSGKKNLVALSGGRIAKSFFVQSAAVLAEAPRNKRDSIQFFWA
ncbi:MAG TPA: hypothetical protein VHH88_08775, partial [Verrucomicrobiae bacterium]|nr:hypothetical protein [Verrucomicrobiae bacterium]